jgi:hypothetical protein
VVEPLVVGRALADGFGVTLGAGEADDDPGAELAPVGPDNAWVGESKPRHATIPRTATAAAATSIQPLNRRRSAIGTTTVAASAGAASAGGGVHPVTVRSPE